MRGHITKRGKNSYTVVIDLGTDPATGKRRQQWLTIQGNKKDAEKRLSELLHQLDSGAYIQPGKTTLGSFLDRWLSDYAWPNLSPRTAEGYEMIIRKHLIPALGNINITQLKPEHIQRYYSDKLAAGLSARTVRHHHMVLHISLQTAIKWGLLIRNPVDAVDTPRAQRHEINTMDEDDIRRLLELVRGTPYYALFYLAIYTGARRSELLALRWQDVDFIYNQLYINRSLHRLKDGSIVFRPPKSAKGRRAIALPPSAALILQEYREEQESLADTIGYSLSDSDLVFRKVDGEPLLPDTVSQAWKKYSRKAGLKGIRLHDARHSHASLMLKQGIHPKVVQERLGHASIQMTLDTYSHVTPGLQEMAASRFDEGLKNKPVSNPLAKDDYVNIEKL